MHKPFDQFGKSLAGRFLEQYARVELEHEVQHAPQSVDIMFEPDGRMPESPLGGWLGRIATAGPGVFECFSHRYGRTRSIRASTNAMGCTWRVCSAPERTDGDVFAG